MRMHTALAHGPQIDPYEMAPQIKLSQSKSVRNLKPIQFEGNIAEYQSLSRRISAAEGPLELLTLGSEDQPPCLSDRSHTLNIFKHKSRQIRQINNIAYSNKKRGDDQIRPTDSLKTVNALVGMRKTEYELKKKPNLKGSMFLNDLWGQGYEKDVLKSAMLRRQLAKQKSLIRTVTSGGQPHQVLNNPTPGKSEVPMIPLHQAAEGLVTGKDNRYYLAHFAQFDSPKTENSEYYSTNNTAWVTEASNSQPRKSFRIRTEHSPHSNKSPGGTTIGGSPKFSKNFASPKSSPRSHLWGSPSSGRKKSLAIHHLSDEDELDPSKKKIQLSRGLIAQDTKMFIGKKNQQCNILLEDCDNELQDKYNWFLMMNNLEELFVNAKYDKKKKMEVNQKTEMKNNFQFMFSRKGRSSES